jgi:hypothetical protein
MLMRPRRVDLSAVTASPKTRSGILSGVSSPRSILAGLALIVRRSILVQFGGA